MLGDNAAVYSCLLLCSSRPTLYLILLPSPSTPPEGTMKGAEDIKAIFNKQKIDLRKPVAVTCGSPCPSASLDPMQLPFASLDPMQAAMASASDRPQQSPCPSASLDPFCPLLPLTCHSSLSLSFVDCLIQLIPNAINRESLSLETTWWPTWRA